MNEGILVAYSTYRAENNIKVDTIKQELYAIQSVLYDYGVQIQIKNFQTLEKVLLGMKKLTIPVQNKKLEITPTILQTIIESLPKSSHYDTQVYKAAFTIAVYGMLRCGEFASQSQKNDIKTLRLHNVEIIKMQNNHPVLRLFIPVSKTDLFRQGIHIHLPCICEFQLACPVHEYKTMIKLRNENLISINPNSPLFLFKNGTVLQRKHVTQLLNKFNLEQNIGLQKFTGHSFRRGGATALAQNGTPDWIIQMLGRWKSDSYKRYIGCEPSQICAYIKHMITGDCVHN